MPFFRDQPEAHAGNYLNRAAKLQKQQRLTCDNLFFGDQPQAFPGFDLQIEGKFPLHIKIPIFHHFCSSSSSGGSPFSFCFQHTSNTFKFPQFSFGKSLKIFFPTDIQISPIFKKLRTNFPIWQHCFIHWQSSK